MIGVVTNNADPDSGGRVKVKLPALGDQVESQWARVVTVGGGANRGITFVPECERRGDRRLRGRGRPPDPW
jgi:uncharacterized protein involved in type VI secretion and phage assembly